jgi:hypothetical protein
VVGNVLAAASRAHRSEPTARRARLSSRCSCCRLTLGARAAARVSLASPVPRRALMNSERSPTAKPPNAAPAQRARPRRAAGPPRAPRARSRAPWVPSDRVAPLSPRMRAGGSVEAGGRHPSSGSGLLGEASGTTRSQPQQRRDSRSRRRASPSASDAERSIRREKSAAVDALQRRSGAAPPARLRCSSKQRSTAAMQRRPAAGLRLGEEQLSSLDSMLQPQ